MIPTKRDKLIYLMILILGLVGVFGLVAWRNVARAVNPTETTPGETLDLVNYMFFNQNGALAGKGVFLGTYAVGLSHCAWYEQVTEGGQDKLKCYTTIDDTFYSGSIQSTGFGVLFLEYPQTCEIVGHCVSVPKIKVMIPVVEDGHPDYDYNWLQCSLTGANSEVGHIWSQCISLGAGGVVVKHALADYEAGPLHF